MEKHTGFANLGASKEKETKAVVRPAFYSLCTDVKVRLRFDLSLALGFDRPPRAVSFGVKLVRWVKLVGLNALLFLHFCVGWNVKKARASPPSPP